MNYSNITSKLVASLFTGIRILLRLLSGALGLLAEGTKVPDTNDATNHAVRGSVLNYRTGKLDDGTDPYGWYERD
jgi:hypothetical protein